MHEHMRSASTIPLDTDKRDKLSYLTVLTYLP